MRARNLALLLPALLGACVATTTSTRTWGGPAETGWARQGRVESVRETVRRQQGDPAAGAVAGAIIGGILGGAMTGHSHVDAWGRVHTHANPAGAVAGAVGGAMVGAAASEGSAEDRTYEVFVRFDDGALESFVYQGALPFNVGDGVVQTQQGLARM
jgi:outer membrane lipoprotein SlyB